MDKRETWEMAREVTRRMNARYEGAMDQAAREMGLEPVDAFRVLMPAFLFEPDPISARRMRKRSPYNSPTTYESSFQRARDKGLLEEAPEGGYRLSKAGHEAVRRFVWTGWAMMRVMPELPPEEMEALRLLLAKLVQACILSPEPPGKWGILHSRRLEPLMRPEGGGEPGRMMLIDQYLADLAAFRDDAHIASWARYGIGGHAWDILGILWDEKPGTEGEILAAVRRREWKLEETRAAMQELLSRGWISGDTELALTEEGKRVRDDAEALTDEYFFRPWEELAEDELGRMGELLGQLADRLE